MVADTLPEFDESEEFGDDILPPSNTSNPGKPSKAYVNVSQFDFFKKKEEAEEPPKKIPIELPYVIAKNVIVAPSKGWHTANFKDPKTNNDIEVNNPTVIAFAEHRTGKFTVPEIKFPKTTIAIPKITVPKIKTIRVKMPRIKVETVKVPKIKLPKPPRLRYKFKKPALPKIAMPKVDVRLPRAKDIKMPKIKFPSVKVPKVTAPKMPDFSQVQGSIQTVKAIPVPGLAQPFKNYARKRVKKAIGTGPLRDGIRNAVGDTAYNIGRVIENSALRPIIKPLNTFIDKVINKGIIKNMNKLREIINKNVKDVAGKVWGGAQKLAKESQKATTTAFKDTFKDFKGKTGSTINSAMAATINQAEKGLKNGIKDLRSATGTSLKGFRLNVSDSIQSTVRSATTEMRNKTTEVLKDMGKNTERAFEGFGADIGTAVNNSLNRTMKDAQLKTDTAMKGMTAEMNKSMEAFTKGITNSMNDFRIKTQSKINTAFKLSSEKSELAIGESYKQLFKMMGLEQGMNMQPISVKNITKSGFTYYALEKGMKLHYITIGL